jgi:CDP-diacylglycerol--glycerol-3-phosphate 3-phosphatidyltransferase
MLAIAVLFSKGAFEHYFIEQTMGMTSEMVDSILAGAIEDVVGLRWKEMGWHLSWSVGLVLLWVAALLTLITGWDYFRKSLPFLRDPQ